MSDKVVSLKDGRKGKCIGRIESGEFILISGKGGQVSFFRGTDVEMLNRPIKEGVKV